MFIGCVNTKPIVSTWSSLSTLETEEKVIERAIYVDNLKQMASSRGIFLTAPENSLNPKGLVNFKMILSASKKALLKYKGKP